METFEDFLKEIHAEVYTGTDDDMPDAFDNWLGELDGEDYIKWGDLYGQKMHIAGSRETIAELKTAGSKMSEGAAFSQSDRDAEAQEEN